MAGTPRDASHDPNGSDDDPAGSRVLRPDLHAAADCHLLCSWCWAWTSGSTPPGLLPATVVLLFVPFVWGLGIILSAATITFKQGGAGLLGSPGSSRRRYFPVTLFSAGLLSKVAEHNPMTVTIDALRDLLLGGAGWSEVGDAAAVLHRQPRSHVTDPWRGSATLVASDGGERSASTEERPHVNDRASVQDPPESAGRRVSCRPRKAERFCSISKRRSITASTPWGY